MPLFSPCGEICIFTAANGVKRIRKELDELGNRDL